MCDIPGPYSAYHFFSNGNYTHVEIEFSTGKFQRFGYGQLRKFNPASPYGGYFYGSCSFHPNANTFTYSIDHSSQTPEHVPFRAASYANGVHSCSSFVRVQFGAFNNWAGSGRGALQSLTSEACQGGGCHDFQLRELSPAPLNGVGVLLPNIVSINRNNEYLSPFGTMEDIRYMRMDHYLPGEEFSLGSDTWKVFPWYQKGGHSELRGIAYRKVT